MKTVVWVLVSPMLHALAFVTALVCVIFGTIFGHLTPQQLIAVPNGSVANPQSKNEPHSSTQDSQQPSSSEPSSGAEHSLSKVVREFWCGKHLTLHESLAIRRHVRHRALLQFSQRTNVAKFLHTRQSHLHFKAFPRVKGGLP